MLIIEKPKVIEKPRHGISLDEFHKLLDKLPVREYIVAIRQKASWETEWEYLKEILSVDLNYDNHYVWENDWNEGQQDVEVLGYIAVEDVKQFIPCGDWRF